MKILQILAAEFNIKQWQAENLAAMLDEGNTLPFIARYRKEQHGSLDDQTLRKLTDRLASLRALQKRREEIINSLENLGVMSEELENAIGKATTQSELEDIYRPYKPKRRTRASVAREKGLEPLAQLLLAQEKNSPEPSELAEPYVDADKGIADVDEALAGARDIIAEEVSDDAQLRRRLRTLIQARGRLLSAAATEENANKRAKVSASVGRISFILVNIALYPNHLPPVLREKAPTPSRHQTQVCLLSYPPPCRWLLPASIGRLYGEV